MRVKHGIFYDGAAFALTIQQSFPYSAELLKRQFEKHMTEQLQRVQRDAYNEGWRNAKAKTKKKIYLNDFDGSW